jgi:hypothetical protein
MLKAMFPISGADMREIFMKVVKSYYWVTFVFLLLDKAFGIDIRVSGFIDHPLLKNGYYAFCFICLGLILWKPVLTFPVAMLESFINMTILCVGIMLPIYTMPGDLADGIPVNPLTGQRITNFFLTGMICVWSFYGHFNSADVRRFDRGKNE